MTLMKFTEDGPLRGARARVAQASGTGGDLEVLLYRYDLAVEEVMRTRTLLRHAVNRNHQPSNSCTPCEQIAEVLE